MHHYVRDSLSGPRTLARLIAEHQLRRSLIPRSRYNAGAHSRLRFPVHTIATWLIVALIVFPYVVQADPLPRLPQGKNLQVSGADSHLYDFSLSSTFDRILGETASTELYDPFTIATLKRMQAEAAPTWDPAGIDPDLTRHVAERAFAIQAGRSFVTTLKKSDLRETYRDVVSGFTAFQDAVRFSVRNQGSGYSLSSKGPGKKLLEFNVEFNLRQGLDPQIRIGSNMRFRYDHAAKAPVLEYGFTF